MAKKLAEVLAFKPIKSQIIEFPNTKMCGCGCGELLNIREDSFIISDELGWYVDEYDFLKGVEAIERNGFYYFKDDNSNYRYTKSEFYEEMSAYWVNVWAPIA